MNSLFIFILWRHFKLSIAEIYAVYPSAKIIDYGKEYIIIGLSEKEKIISKAEYLWGSIKIIETSEIDSIDEIADIIKEKSLSYLEQNEFNSKNISELNTINNLKKISKKITFAINKFGDSNINQKTILIKTKNYLKENFINSRFVNKDWTNTNSAQIKKDKLILTKSDYNLVIWKNKIFFWPTIWSQDVDEYTSRDINKTRDFQTGMLPPKLAQMMINISKSSLTPLIKEEVIYDPFVGFGTILIESINMWNTEVYGSDINKKNVENTIYNLEKFKIKTNKEFNHNIIDLNAKYIYESEILKNYKISSIVTEWYLWEMMTKENISIERIKSQKEKLKDIYLSFFRWLSQIKFIWNIVISFPFWEMKGKYYFFEEIYDILKDYCEVQDILPDIEWLSTTKYWSLLYKRKNQLVGREIFKLKIKNDF